MHTIPHSDIGPFLHILFSLLSIILDHILFILSSANVTGPDKTGLIAIFCISRNTDFNIECTVLLTWLDKVTPDILYNKCV